MSRGVRLVLLVAAAAALAVSSTALGKVDFPRGTIPAPTVSARSFTVEEDQTYNDVIATFESFRPPTSTFSVSVNWGDGSSSAASFVFTGQTTQRGNLYRANGSHRYTSSGTYTVTVTVTDSAGAVGTGQGTATVTPHQQPPPPPPPPPTPPPPPAAADLVLTQEQAPARPRAGGTLTYTFTARNRGPGTATRATLVNDPPDGSSFVSASAAPAPPAIRIVSGGQDACAAQADGNLRCELGTLAPGAGAVVTHVVRLGAGVLAGNSARIAADQTDPVATDNVTAEEVAVAPPPPVRGRSVNVTPVSGVVLFRPRGAASFRPLGAETSIPTGSQIDTRRGRVRLLSARGGGATDSGEFYQGVFAIFQARAPGAFTELRLAGGSFRICPAGLRSPASSRNHPQHPVRRLWGDAKGRFRTRGRYAAATVRGTRWLTLDRCDGTLVRVQVGRILVRDFPRSRSVQLRAGQSYLARARR